ncbi:MAG TPA: AMP-binding protein [Blastocatellia bacterium]|nr:AMP-binding protein [Blastocatellia bacterium]
MLTVELIRRGARYFAGRTAVLFEDKSLTFGEVNDLSNRFANVLASKGVNRGSRLAILANNSLYSMAVDFGCVKAGAARTPLNARLSIDEHEHMLRDTGARLVIYDAELAERAEALGDRVAGVTLLGLGSDRCGADLLVEASSASPDDPLTPADPDDVILTVFTSGTTGRLKAAEHTQATFAAVCNNISINLPDVGADDVMLHAASLFHASGCFLLPYWMKGACSAVLARFEPAEFLNAIVRWQATSIHVVPTMLAMLLAHPDIERADLSSVRTILYGASPMPLPVIKRALEIWGPRFVQYYGQTEAPLFITKLDKQDHTGPERRLLACGRPSVDCEIRLLGDDGTDAAPGEQGEIALRAPFAMAGYLNAPDLNAAMFLEGGWLRTRDVGRFDDEGHLYLVDRTSDMIVTGGYNVYPREVEDALLAHTAVLECAVVGAPHEKWVEAVTAFIVLRSGCEVSAGELIDYARSRLASYKVPKSVHFIEQIPKSAVGKVLRRALRDPLWKGSQRA